ncbi:MAG: glycosyltransferase [Nanoarchaeota archaeon]|nr:glycosyltransferase [Nanoarchaeota archaeon]MBU2442453.1 glycosyltransferase [Nanoarchaeota archaeon]
MKINIINSSPKNSAIWKVGYYNYLELKKDTHYDVKFIDLWEENKVSHNNIIRALQLLKGINLNLKKDEINYYMTPLMSKTMRINKAKQNIMFIHDLYPLYYSGIGLKTVCKILYKQSTFANLIVTNSDTTKNEYLQEYGKTNKIFSNHLGLDKKYFKVKTVKKPKKLTFISIGRDEPRKNLEFIINILNKINVEFELIRIGEFSKKNISKLNKIKNKIRIYKNVNENELIKLYSKSHILLFPSTYEGFGMPPIEAMACECIPLVSDKTSLPEVVQNEELIIPLEEEKWIEKIKQIIKDESYKKELIQFGKQQINKYIWKEHKERFEKILNYL